jgi:hypothetical protein
METESKKYNEVLNILKKSKPELRDVEAVANKVMKQLQEGKARVSLPELFIEFLFGWVYIGWIRKSLVAAALIIVVFFGYQQALILRRINDLSGQRIQNGALLMTGMKDDLETRIRFYKISGGKFPDEKPVVSIDEIDEMIKSINNLQSRYKEVISLIEDDPDLKKYVENRINELKKSKN